MLDAGLDFFLVDLNKGIVFMDYQQENKLNHMSKKKKKRCINNYREYHKVV